jgi:hypothetical protein
MQFTRRLSRFRPVEWFALAFGGISMGVLWGGMFALFAESIHHANAEDVAIALSSGEGSLVSYGFLALGFSLGTIAQAVWAAIEL